MKLGMRLAPGGAARQGDGALFYLVSKHICQSSEPQSEDEPPADTGLAFFPVRNRRKQTVSGCKDDSVLSERTSDGPLQGDRERSNTFLHVSLSLIK